MAAPDRTVRVFISYSHRGNGPQWKAALLQALQVFERQHLLDVWEDGKIRVSRYWDDDIKAAMNNASIAVVLLTPDAIAPRDETDPNYILDTEFPALRQLQQEKRLIVFPVICEDCPWTRHDWLRATQAPNNSNPLADLSPEAQARVFRQLATAIAEAISHGALAESPRSETPPPEDHLYLDRFPLTRGPGLREEKLIGREQELALLDLAFAQPHTSIVSLVAWGGVGKTMLVQHWLQRLQREGWFGACRVYAWSFYSQGTQEDRQASEDLFLAHALEWFGVQCEPTLSPWDKGRLLADAVMRERTLLILDGIEPLQYPPGPIGGQLRAPGVQCLLKQLARKASADVRSQKQGGSNCLCLVTTREPLTDLADFQRREGSPWGSVLRVDLGNLTVEAGAALLHHAGANRAGAAEIKADDKELLTASREVDGHALTLNLLGRFLARAHGGDIRRRDLVKFEDADRKEQGGTTFKMLAAFERWFAKSGEFGGRQLAVLRILGLFDRPADAGSIGALRKPPVITGLTDPLFQTRGGFLGWGTRPQPLTNEDWNTAASFLADFGLIVIQAYTDNCDCLLDCHPLIREHFSKQLHDKYSEGFRAAHRRLFEHLCVTTNEAAQPTLDELQPLYHAVAHGCQAGLVREVCSKVYYERINRKEEFFSTNKLGAFGQDLTAVACFFDNPWSRVSPSLNDVWQAWMLNQAAFRLRAVGRLAEAITPMEFGLRLVRRRRDWHASSIDSNNLSEMNLVLGNVPEAIRYAQMSCDYAESVRCETRNQESLFKSKCVSTFANSLHQAGQRDEALAAFNTAETLQVIGEADWPILYSVRGFQFCELLLTTSESDAWLSQFEEHDGNNTELANARRVVSQRVTQMREWRNNPKWNPAHETLLDAALIGLTLGRAMLYTAILEKLNSQEASDEIDRAMECFHRAGTQHEIPCALLTRAWLRNLRGNADGARVDLDEAWGIASRGSMRLHLADIHLYRARLFFREKVYPWESPQEDLAAAEKLINECGYHRRDEELAYAKRAILANTA